MTINTNCLNRLKGKSVNVRLWKVATSVGLRSFFLRDCRNSKADPALLGVENAETNLLQAQKVRVFRNRHAEQSARLAND